MKTVRLTVQIKDHDNMQAITERIDVPLNKVAQCAGELASHMAAFHRRAQKASAVDAEHQG